VKWWPKEYIDAAQERIRDARELRVLHRYASAMYSSGLAAECTIRSFFPPGAEFEARHDIGNLFRACEWQPSETVRRKLESAIQVVHSLWQNNYRFASEEKIRSHLKALHMDRQGIQKGADFLKVRCSELEDASTFVVEAGVRSWQRQSEKK